MPLTVLKRDEKKATLEKNEKICKKVLSFLKRFRNPKMHLYREWVDIELVVQKTI